MYLKYMFRFVLGFMVGIYSAQNYDLPDIEEVSKRLLSEVERYKKPPSK